MGSSVRSNLIRFGRFDQFVLPDVEWDLAKCDGLGPDGDPIFFSEKKGRGSADEARAFCSGCVIKEQCLEYALADPQLIYGVWGGKTAKERQTEVRRRRRVSAVERVRRLGSVDGMPDVRGAS